MTLFDIENGKVVLKASSLAIPEFKLIWEKDKTKSKDKAYNQLSYIIFLCDVSLSNPYRNYTDEDRNNILKKDFLGGKDPDEDMLNAIVKYRKLQETVSVRMLRSAKNAAEKLSIYFDNIDFDLLDKFNKPVYSARDVASNLKEIGSIVKSLGILEDQVKKEQSSSGKVRGGVDIGDYEMPDENFDYGE